MDPNNYSAIPAFSNGTVYFTIYHCDGDSCTFSKKWEAPVFPDTWPHMTQIAIGDSLFAVRFKVAPDKTHRYGEVDKIKWVQAIVIDKDAEIFAVSGGTEYYKGMQRDSALDISTVRHDNKTAMFELTEPVHLDSIVANNHFNMIFKKGRPAMKFYFMNEDGRIMAHDSIVVQSMVNTNVQPINMPDYSGSIGLNLMPNPANTEVTINYSIPVSTSVNVSLCDILGKSIKTIEISTTKQAGYRLNENTSDLAAGTYFIQIRTTVGTQTAKLVITH